ncbi:LOW QUALITY PROTEIN: polyketide synthase [Bipolaris maydis]|nr:LOW QUALITY PROTEIN: polyketide synthase [Bipolaris maydis]
MDQQPDPIAICGMALRLPGALKTPAQFWTFLTEKKDARAPIPFARFDAEAFYSASGKSGYFNSKNGYYLDDSAEVGALDTSLFRMSQQESERMDPQAKILLELARECFESAGETDWRGKDIGTYVGSFGNDWLEMAAKDRLDKNMYKVSGYSDFLLSNRLSYEYDLRGPSMTIRTACSASLMGLHEACLAIRNGDCSAALVGGSNLFWSPDTMADMSEQGVTSPNASCRSFDADADGYARAEAVNLIYIKPLSAAIKHGNPIRAIIRGSSLNADGKTPGPSMPSSSSQAALIRRAYQNAGIPESEIIRTAFVECHATGTATGDPIEATAVGNVFGNGGVYIGSVKPNVGHSEGASGITSIIKAVLALENRVIPPNIKFETPNPKIPFLEKDLKVPTDCLGWPKDKLERVSVNNFGIGGANAHFILDSAASYGVNSDIIADPEREESFLESLKWGKLFLITASTSESLEMQTRNLRDYALSNPTKAEHGSYTLACRREHFSHRAFSVIQELSVDSQAGVSIAGVSPLRLVMIFTGQGAQWPRMGIELLQSNTTFASSIKEMDQELRGLPTPPTWSIEEELAKGADSSNLNEAAISQPLCTAVQVALVDALANLAIKPHSVLGHSSGEIAAAYAANRISRRAAIVLAYYRGLVSQAATRSGAMAAIGLSWDEVTPFLQEGVVIACNNSPSNVTISGDEAVVRNVVQAIQTSNTEVFVRMLKVSTAYHSHHMLNAGNEYEEMVASFLEGEVPYNGASTNPGFFSTVTGLLLPDSERIDAQYFRRNLESPVLFLQALDSLLTGSKDSAHRNLCFLEVGPHSTLSGPLRQIFTQNSVAHPYASCLHREKNANATYLAALGTLWQHGLNFDLYRLTNPLGIAKVLPDMPTYPWYHGKSHIIQNRIAQAWRYPKFPHHELLGSLVLENNDDQPSFRNLLQLENAPWIRDHNIDGDVVFPGAAYVTMAGEACRRQCLPDQDHTFFGFSVKNMVIGAALILQENKPVEIVTSLRRWRITDHLESSGWEFMISSFSGTTWTTHCSGCVEAIYSSPPPPAVPETAFPRRTDAKKWYQAMWHLGARYGPCFQGLKNIECTPNKSSAKATICDKTPDGSESHYLIHPTTIDVFFQTMAAAACNGQGHATDRMSVPTFIKRMDIYESSGDLQVHTSAKVLAHGKFHGWGCAIGQDGALAISIDQIKLMPLDTALEIDLHAGASTTWSLEPSFTTMSSILKNATALAKQTPLMQEFALLHIRKALEQIQSIKPASDTMERYVNWMKRQSIPDTLRPMETVTSEVKTFSCPSTVDAIVKISENIIKLVLGEVSATELLMVDDMLLKIYQEAKVTDRGPYIKLLGHQKPNMRILEIGAGAGGTTHEFLSNLVNDSDGGKLWSSYTYTDISAGFFGAAKESFKEHTLEYKVLDITKDPVAQGFEGHDYDLIIATNVMHAVPNLQQALRNVHSLLRHDGTFYLEELCSDVQVTNFIMGLLPGWWVGEQDGRVDEPYVHPERWDGDLRAAGFTGVADCMLDAPRPHQGNAFMIAYPAIKDALPKPVTLLYDDASQQVVEDLKNELSQHGCFETVLQHWDSAESVVAKRNIICLLDINKPFFFDIEASRFDKFRHWMAQVAESKNGILWLTRSSQLSCEHPRWGQTPGAMRTIQKDMGIDLAICELDRLTSLSLKAVAQISERFSRRHTSSHKLELEYAIEDGNIYIPRLYPLNVDSELCKPDSSATTLPQTDNGELNLTLGTVGRLDTLQWTTCSYERPGENEVAIEIMATGLNFRQAPRQVLGLEAAGMVRDVGSGVENLQPGDRVVVVGGTSLFRTAAVVPSTSCWKLPHSLSFEEAATMPCVFMTVIHGLLEFGQMHSGHTVLIHSACGGVGLAAIQLCHMAGATIYCTVSNEEKVQFLEDEFKIPRAHIFNSRNRSFVDDVMRATNGAGVDLVLNSLSGELLHASWECVAEFGKMIEIGKRDLLGNGRVSLHPFVLNRSFHGIDLAHLIERRPAECRRLLGRMMTLYEAGHIKPISPAKTFKVSEVEQCFRYMQQGRHIGKIILRVGDSADEATRSKDLITAHPKRNPTFNPQASYLLAGGLGGLGRIVANWMVENGARHLIFLSRNAGEKETDKAFFEELEYQGCKVMAVKGSVSVVKDVEKAIAAATAPVRGVMNICMQLQDMGFNQMTYEAWSTVNESKIKGTWNMHNVCMSREISLDFFLLFSSVSGLFGNFGQANYAAANTFLDTFVLYRHSLGLNASAIDIGMMYDHGYIAENPLLAERMQLLGAYGIRIPQLLDAITLVLSTPRSKPEKGTSRKCASLLGIGVRSGLPLSDPANRIMWKDDRRMAYYANLDSDSNAASGATSDPTQAIRAFMKQPKILDQPDTSAFLARQIARKIALMLLRPLDDKEDSEDAGLDSLVAIEMRRWWRTTFGFDITMLQMNTMALGDRATEGLRIKYAEIEVQPVTSTPVVAVSA